MVRRNVFVKVSGDLYNREDFLSWIEELDDQYYVVILIGGGTQINQAFANAGIPVTGYGPLGREIESFEHRQLARDILEKNQRELQDILAERGINVSVVIPVIEIGTVLCHVNGDIFILCSHHGFDRLFVVTTNDRVEEKKRIFAPYPKIEIRGF